MLNRHGGAITRDEALGRYLQYMDDELRRGTPLRAMARHLPGLFAGCRGARAWRRFLSELPPGAAGLAALQRLGQNAAPAIGSRTRARSARTVLAGVSGNSGQG